MIDGIRYEFVGSRWYWRLYQGEQPVRDGLCFTLWGARIRKWSMNRCFRKSDVLRTAKGGSE